MESENLKTEINKFQIPSWSMNFTKKPGIPKPGTWNLQILRLTQDNAWNQQILRLTQDNAWNQQILRLTQDNAWN